MTEHLPECPLLEPCFADHPEHGFCSRQNAICIHCERACICESGGLITRQRAEQIGRNIGKYGCVITEQRHLPECPQGYSVPFTLDRCICDELRACEKRVWEKFPAALSATSVQSMSIYGQGLREGFLSAIDAAEAAVAAMPLTGGWTTPDGVIEEIDKAKTIAAIDALRKEN